MKRFNFCRLIIPFLIALLVPALFCLAQPCFAEAKTAEDFVRLGNAIMVEDIEDALRQFDEAIELDSSLHTIYIGRAKAYMKSGDYHKAIADLNKCCDLLEAQSKPLPAQVYLLRGDCFKSLGDYSQAVRDYSDGIALEPKNRDLYFARAGAYGQMNNRLLSFKDEAMCLSLDNPKRPVTLRLRFTDQAGNTRSKSSIYRNGKVVAEYTPGVGTALIQGMVGGGLNTFTSGSGSSGRANGVSGTNGGNSNRMDASDDVWVPGSKDLLKGFETKKAITETPRGQVLGGSKKSAGFQSGSIELDGVAVNNRKRHP